MEKFSGECPQYGNLGVLCAKGLWKSISVFLQAKYLAERNRAKLQQSTGPSQAATGLQMCS